MQTTPDSFSTLAAAVLPRSGTPFEGYCSANGRSYSLCLVGDRAYDTYTLDYASGRERMKVTRRRDGSFLTREGNERGWRVSSTAEVALAKAILSAAAEAETEMRFAEVAPQEHENVISITSCSKRRSTAATLRWVRSTATRAILAAAFSFVLLALL